MMANGAIHTRKECVFMLVKQWSFGDKVVHSQRPEWGTGTVTSAAGDVHEGSACQRLTVRFDRGGVKTLNTAMAKLIAADDAPRISAQAPDDDDPLAMAIAGPSAKEVMLRLPDETNDPFTTPRSRLAAVLKLYKYSEHGASLLDWAASQTGLKDPMTRFSRHELEDFFKRFCFVRDEQLKRVVIEVKKTEPSVLAAQLAAAPRSAQQALRRMETYR